MEAIPAAAVPSTALVVRWSVNGRDSFPEDQVLSMKLTPPAGVFLSDGGEGGLNRDDYTMIVPAELSTGGTAWFISDEAVFPLVFTAELLLDDEAIATGEISVPLVEYIEAAALGPDLSPLSSGVTVISSNGEGQHPFDQ